MKNWDGHRNTLGIIHYEYLNKDFIFVFNSKYFLFFKNKNKKKIF